MKSYLSLAILFLISFSISAQFTSGRIVAVQTTGSGSKAGSPVTLREYTTTGGTGISVPIPASGATPLQMAAGSGGSEGFLTRSTDGKYLLLAGYSTSTSGISDITVTTASAVPRVIFKVDASGAYAQVGSSTTNYSANDIRGAISDGTNYWASGASNTGVDGIDYYGPGAPTALGINSKAYGLQIFNNQIYFSTQKNVAGVTPNFGIYTLGNGLPTSGVATPSLLINTGAATPVDFSLNGTADLCYIAINLNSPLGGIQKWTKSGATWTLAYTLGTGAVNTGAYGLAVDYSGANPVIYASTFESNTVGNRIVKIIDAGAGSVATTLVPATANTFFHGISFAPVKACVPPVQPGSFVTGADTVYKGQSNVAYSVPQDTSVTYTWSYSGTGVSVNGTGNAVTLNFSANAASGTLSVVSGNSCGTSAARTKNITTVTLPGIMRITEYMYNGSGTGSVGEFVELTNVGGTSVDMTGWSFDDNSRTSGSQNLSAFGTVQPGESVILTDNTASAFLSSWNLCNPIKIIGGNSNNLGREDEINLYNSSNVLVDRLTYGDQTFAPGSVRTASKSAWVSAAGIGNNNIGQWTLSAIADAEASYSSSLGEIGSPGTSARAAVAFGHCTVINGAPTISLDVVNTSNFIDGGLTTSPASPLTVSGVVNDPTDPARTLGLVFTINDAETPVASLGFSVTSSNGAVVPNANVFVTGAGSSRIVKIIPAGVGYSTITISVNDGTNVATYSINYAASVASSTPTATVWHTGISDASDAVALDDSYYVTGDDELNVLNVYSRTSSGLPLASYNFTSNLALPEPSKPETDLEAATKSVSNANKVYWLGSMSNGKAPFDNKPNRDRIFATTISGTGAGTTFSFSGYYGNLRANILTWGDAHGYNFTASAAAGVDSKAVNGFAAEGMVFGPDNTTLYIGLRAPLVPTSTRTKAVIVPVLNFESWFNSGAPSGNPAFGTPIELELGSRGIRDLARLSNGTYIIIAGNPGGSPNTSAIFKWTGNASDAPVLVKSPVNTVLNMEGVMQVNEGGNLSLSKLQIISDGGDEILYNDGNEAKDFADLELRKFRSDVASALDLSVCVKTTGDTSATVCGSFTWYGITYTASGSPKHVFVNAGGCDSTVTLHLTVRKPSASDTSMTACDSLSWNGNTYTASGTYTFTPLNTSGCDSTATLILTINHSSSSNTIRTACSSYTWNWVTYTSSGTYTFTTLNTSGCDSTATLILTINHSSSSNTVKTACSSYTWNGVTYTSSGTYTFTTLNSSGCDSTATLTLTINTPANASISVNGSTSFCQGGSVLLTASEGVSYVWSNGETTQFINVNASGNYSVVVTGTNGCEDSSSAVTISVISATSIATQPLQTTVCEGTDATYSIVGSGAGVKYQWQEYNLHGPFHNIADGAQFDGSTSNTLVVHQVNNPMNGYKYRCVVSGTCGPEVISAGKPLVVKTIVIGIQPTPQTACVNKKAYFSVKITSGTGILYQWQRKSGNGAFVDLSNGGGYLTVNTAKLTINGAKSFMNGNQFRCAVRQACSPDVIHYSDAAALHVDLTCSTAREAAESDDNSAEEIKIAVKQTNSFGEALVTISRPMTGKCNWFIYNLLGQQFLSGEIEKDITEKAIDISSLTNGIYFMRIIDSEGKKTFTRFPVVNF